MSIPSNMLILFNNTTLTINDNQNDITFFYRR